MQIRLVQAKTILNPSKLSRGYTLNPYLGCTHGCVYCYNQNFIQRLRPQEKWGRFMEVKINAPEILEEEIKKKPVGSVFLSTVTDPYNPLEAKYQITRKCLKILIGNFRPISILTKSNLVLRDLDLFKESTQKVEVGFTLTTLDDRIARIIEPTASVPSERIKALAIFRQAGIRTYAFIGPVLPQLTDLSAIFSALREKVDEIWIDTLNIKGENWQGLKKKIGRHWPNLIPLYKEIFFKNRREYENQLQQEAKKLGRFYKMSIKISF